MKSKAYLAFATLCLIYTFCAQIGTSYYGRADNGDFTRSSWGYAEKPVGFAVNWPDKSTPEGVAAYNERFFTYYHPFWVIQPDATAQSAFKHSVHLFWTPGFILNKLVFSKKVLDMRYVSMFLRLAIIASYLGTLALLYLKRAPLAASMFLAGLLTLIFNDVYYLSYLNSFYQEAGALACLVAILPGLLLLAYGSHRLSLALLVASLCLYGTAKTQYAPTGLVLGLIIVAVYNLSFFWERPALPKQAALALSGLCAAALLGAFIYSVGVYTPSTARLCASQRYFSGVLYMSKDPVPHLLRAGYKAEDKQYVGKYSGPAEGPLRARDFISVILHEPMVLPRYLMYCARDMQNIKVLQYSIFPKNGVAKADVKAPFGFWASLKDRFFPRGWLFIAVQAAIALVGGWALYKIADKRWRRMLFVLLIMNLGVWTEIGACLGDGIIDLTKHLVFANLLFDFQLGMCGFLLLQAPELFRKEAKPSAEEPAEEQAPEEEEAPADQRFVRV